MICEGCQTSYHLYCLASKVPPEATSAKCINCGNMIDLPDSGDGASNARSCNGGGRSGGEKRKRISAVVDSDSEDSE